MSLKSKVYAENILKEWDLGMEYTVTGADGQKLFNENDNYTDQAKKAFKEIQRNQDWIDINDLTGNHSHTKLKGKDLYDLLMMLANNDMLFDRSDEHWRHDPDDPDVPKSGAVTPWEVKFNYKKKLGG